MKKRIDIKKGWDSICKGTEQDYIDELLGRGMVNGRYSDVYFVDYAPKGIVISYSTEQRTAKDLFFYNNDIGYDTFKTLDLETLEGINWTSTREDILTIYGKPKEEFEFSVGTSKGFRMVYDTFDFRLIDTVLRRIAIY